MRHDTSHDFERSPKTQQLFHEPTGKAIRLTPLMRKQGSSTIVKPKRAAKKSIASSMEFQAKFDRNMAEYSAASAVTTSAGTNNFGVINDRHS